MPTSSSPIHRRKQRHLLSAIKNNNTKEVIQLLKGGCSPSKQLDCYKSRYPLAIAIEQQNIEIISILFQYGASINTPIYASGWTALHRAVVLKNTTMIQTILQYGADYSIADKNGETVLHLVFKETDFLEMHTFDEEQKIVKILEMFLDLGMDVNVKTNAGRSPLYLAGKNKMKIVVEFLITRGANLNICDYKGDSLAHLLVKDQYRMNWNRFAIDSVAEKRKNEDRDYAEFLDWLLIKGLNVDCENKRGELPLQLALKHKLLQTFEILLKYANNVNFIDNCNGTVLHILFEMSGPKELKSYNILDNSESESNMEIEVKQISKSSVERIVNSLLEKGAFVDVVDGNGNTPIHIAAKTKMFKCMLMMMDKFTDVNACNKNMETVLHILASASINCQDSMASEILKVTQELIFRGINVNKVNKDLMTAVQLAVLQKNKEMLELLKNHGGDIHVRTVYGESLLHLATKFSDKKVTWRSRKEETQIVNILEFLLDTNLDVNTRMNNGETVLYLAVKNKMKKVIELLIRREADLNICNRDGDSVIHYLINQKFKMVCSMYDDGIQSDEKMSSKVQENLDFLDWLLSKGVNVDLKNDYGEKPLQLAIKFNLKRVIPILLKYTNEVGFINERKLTVLHMILHWSNENNDDSGYESKSESIEPQDVIFDVKNILQTLLDKGVSVDIKDTFKNTALHIAAQQTEPELTSMLLKHTKNVNVANDLGWTPLHFACQSGNIDTVKILIDHGADLNAIENMSGITPLFAAVYNDHEDIVELLAESGADLNAKDATGQTVLHTVDSLKSSMTTLLKLGADVDVKDDWGNVPIYYAMTRQDLEAIGQLLDYGANVSERTLTDFVLKELLASDSVMGHHAKLMAAQMSIPKIYTTITFHRYASFYKDCLKEVERMRGFKIDDFTTIYDYLHMNSKKRQSYEKKERFQDLMKSLVRQFPFYCDIILAKRQEACNKRSLIKLATVGWWKITEILLPDICLENIFECVDVMTLKALGESLQSKKRTEDKDDLEENPMKRQRLF